MPAVSTTTTNNTNNSNKPLYIRYALLCSLTFFTFWSDVMVLIRSQAFVSAMTGNLVYFGVSVAPPSIKEKMDVGHNPLLYLGMIVTNVLGAVFFLIVKDILKPNKPGCVVAVFVLVMGITGSCIVYFVPGGDSPYLALMFSPIFGCINRLSMSPPLSANTSVMTGNLGKVSKWIMSSVKERKIVTPDPGVLMPIPALCGAAAIAGLLWLDTQNFYNSVWSSITSYIGLAITLVAYDFLKPHMKEPAPATKPTAAAEDVVVTTGNNKEKEAEAEEEKRMSRAEDEDEGITRDGDDDNNNNNNNSNNETTYAFSAPPGDEVVAEA